MTVKDELLIFWICCLVLISFFLRHLLGCAGYLVQQVASVSLIGVPGLLRLFVGHLH
jgi:hypothetical protein